MCFDVQLASTRMGSPRRVNTNKYHIPCPSFNNDGPPRIPVDPMNGGLNNNLRGLVNAKMEENASKTGRQTFLSFFFWKIFFRNRCLQKLEKIIILIWAFRDVPSNENAKEVCSQRSPTYPAKNANKDTDCSCDQLDPINPKNPPKKRRRMPYAIITALNTFQIQRLSNNQLFSDSLSSGIEVENNAK